MSAEREEWRSVVGWPDHEVSNLGRVRRSPSARLLPGHVLRQYSHAAEYPVVHMVTLVHRLVAEAFVGPRPAGFVVNHKNGTKTDNRPENLEWVTRSENQDHALRTGLSSARGEDAGRAKLTDSQVREIRGRYTGAWGEQTRLAREYGVSQMLVSQIVRGEIWTHLDPTYIPRRCENKRIRGESFGRAKLTNDDVREIRRCHLAGDGQEDLARKFGVRTPVVRDIIRGKRWKEVQ